MLSDSIPKHFIPISIKHLGFKPHRWRFTFAVPSNFKVQATSSSSRKEDFVPHIRKNLRKAARGPRRLITISTSDGSFNGKWSCDYVFSVRELRLADLAEDGQKDVDVLVSLTVQKHTGFGFSVDGRIVRSFTRKCSCCFLPYFRKVIYVQPGSEADLDSLIQDTIR